MEVKPFHCYHEGEIDSLKAQNADQYTRIGKIEVAVAELKQVVIGNGVEGLVGIVREGMGRIEGMERAQLTAEAVAGAMQEALKNGVQTRRDKVSIDREKAQMWTARVGAVSGVVGILVIVLSKLGVL